MKTTELPSRPDFKSGLYRHFRGHIYWAMDLALNSETLEWQVIYRDVNTGQYWTRPLRMWTELVSAGDAMKPRFTPINDDNDGKDV